MYIPLNDLNIEEYLQTEESSQIRHEYLGGKIFAMSGASAEHNSIAGNLYTSLRSHLRGSSCRSFISEMKVKLKAQNTDIFYYPDIVVTCNSQDNERYFKTFPCLIIEVLSPTTEAIDRREKLLNYQNLESLQEYVLISQDEIKVEIYRKDPQGNWLVQTLNNSDDRIRLESVGLTITMAQIYEEVFNF